MGIDEIEQGERVADALAWDAEQAAEEPDAEMRAENLADAIGRELEDAADLAEANLVQVEVIRNTTELVSDLDEVRRAVDLLMGDGKPRRIEGTEAPFLVEFRPAELAVLDAQGYISIGKYDYEIVAEMP